MCQPSGHALLSSIGIHYQTPCGDITICNGLFLAHCVCGLKMELDPDMLIGAEVQCKSVADLEF